MNTNTKVVLAIFLIVVSLIAGSVTAIEQSRMQVIGRLDPDFGSGAQVVKIYDPDEHVVCYIYSEGYYRGGISCLPSKETTP